MTQRIRLRGIVEEDFTQFKVPSFVLLSPYCTFKCDRENSCKLCQNSELTSEPIVTVDVQYLVTRYVRNTLTQAVVFSGLEPFDSFDDVITAVTIFRKHTKDPIVIYSGYTYAEVTSEIAMLSQFENIIVKFGRFIPNKPSVFNKVLGVQLASPNQWATKIS